MMSWEVRNLCSQPLTLVSAHLPHGRLRSERIDFEPELVIGADEATVLDLHARCSEIPGTAFENAFLLLAVRWQEEPWLVLVRLRVHVKDEGVPQTETKLVTVQRAGFSARRTGSQSGSQGNCR